MTLSSPLACIILAAGEGTRMKSAVPKVLHEIAGRSMLGWVIGTARELEPEKIVVVTAPGTEAVRDAARGCETVLQKKPLGTGDAVKAALPALAGFAGDVLVLYGDGPLYRAETLRGLLAALHGKQADLAWLGMRPDDPGAYGRMICDTDGKLHKIVEFKDASEEERAVNLCWSGVMAGRLPHLAGWVDKIDNANAKGEYYLTSLPDIAAAEGGVSVTAESPLEETLCANTRAELATLERVMQSRLRTRAMEGGATLIDPGSVFFSADTVLGRDVLVEPHVFFGPGVTVDDHVTIRAFSHIEDTRIKSGVCVGPFARLRKQTTLEENVRIGTFVEVSKSTIGQGTKAMHQTYLGMANIGQNCNIGAGTITCNYDGVKKHETVLDDKVFIGSNSNLVAPITIRSGAFIAAGSTITRDVPANALAVARERTTLIEGWATARRKKERG